jgi:hypothetical protein
VRRGGTSEKAFPPAHFWTEKKFDVELKLGNMTSRLVKFIEGTAVTNFGRKKQIKMKWICLEGGKAGL